MSGEFEVKIHNSEISNLCDGCGYDDEYLVWAFRYDTEKEEHYLSTSLCRTCHADSKRR